MRAGIALGSNLGDRMDCLRDARTAVLALPGVGAGQSRSAPIFQTRPVDCPPGANPFLNSVLEVEYEGDARQLLRELGEIEVAAGRPVRHGINEPRPLDLDILYAGDLVLQTADLILPHPRMFQRRFVLAPLSSIRPDLILPGQLATVAEILAGLDDDPSSVALAGEQW